MQSGSAQWAQVSAPGRGRFSSAGPRRSLHPVCVVDRPWEMKTPERSQVSSEAADMIKVCLIAELKHLAIDAHSYGIGAAELDELGLEKDWCSILAESVTCIFNLVPSLAHRVRICDCDPSRSPLGTAHPGMCTPEAVPVPSPEDVEALAVDILPLVAAPTASARGLIALRAALPGADVGKIAAAHPALLTPARSAYLKRAVPVISAWLCVTPRQLGAVVVEEPLLLELEFVDAALREFSLPQLLATPARVRDSRAFRARVRACFPGSSDGDYQGRGRGLNAGGRRREGVPATPVWRVGVNPDAWAFWLGRELDPAWGCSACDI